MSPASLITCDGKPPSILGTTFAVNLPRDIRLETTKSEPVLTLPSDLETLTFGDVFSQQNGRSELATHSCNSGFTPRPSRDHVKHVLETGCFETIIIVPFWNTTGPFCHVANPLSIFHNRTEGATLPSCLRTRKHGRARQFWSATIHVRNSLHTHTLFKGLCVFWMHFIRVWAPPRFFHLTFGDRLLQPWEEVTLPNRSDRCSAELGGKMCF